MPQCVIFDMDGVIVDSEPLHMEAERNVFHSLGISVSPEMHSTFVGISSHLMWRKVIAHFKLAADENDLVELQRSNYNQILKCSENIVPTPGITKTMNALKQDGFRLALASSSGHNQISFFLSRFGIANLFDAIVSGDDVENGKPHPDIFLKAAGNAGSDPDECIVIEDSENGVKAALEANMKCMGFRNENSGNQDLSGADAIISKFDNDTIQLIKSMLKK